MRRPAHLHFIVRADAFETISTHVFDGGDHLRIVDRTNFATIKRVEQTGRRGGAFRSDCHRRRS